MPRTLETSATKPVYPTGTQNPACAGLVPRRWDFVNFVDEILISGIEVDCTIIEG